MELPSPTFKGVFDMATVIVLLILAAIIGLAVWSIVKDKRSGKSTCGNNCAHCASAGMCHSAPKKHK